MTSHTTDLAPVPEQPGRVVYPVSTNFDLLSITSPGPLNLLLNNDDLQRTVHVYQEGVAKFKFDMFSRKQSSAFDFRLDIRCYVSLFDGNSYI